MNAQTQSKAKPKSADKKGAPQALQQFLCTQTAHTLW